MGNSPPVKCGLTPFTHHTSLLPFARIIFASHHTGLESVLISYYVDSIYQVKTTKAGEKIVVAKGTIYSVDTHKNSYRLGIRLDDGREVVGFRGQSLGEPALGKNQFYIKEADHKEHGNTSWNIGFPAIDDFNPFDLV